MQYLYCSTEYDRPTLPSQQVRFQERFQVGSAEVRIPTPLFCAKTRTGVTVARAANMLLMPAQTTSSSTRSRRKSRRSGEITELGSWKEIGPAPLFHDSRKHD